MSVLISLALGAIPGDRVTSLPGFGVPPTAHYSGYLPVGKYSGVGGMLHYWLQLSENDPATDPVVLWLNGGPGASGIIGMLTELGQLQTIPSPGSSRADCFDNAAAEEDGVPQLFHAEYGWTKVANLLTIEQPKGVGFSYCTGSGPCRNDDTSTAQDTYEALVAFFAAYPEFKASPFYVTGESYAGVYVPMLMHQIDEHGGLPNFDGAAIGNGCWGSDCFYGVHESQIDYHTFLGQDFISPALVERIASSCDGVWLNATSPDGTCGGQAMPQSPCHNLLEEMCTQVGDEKFNVYNMYDTCFPNDGRSLPAVRAALRAAKGATLTSWRDAMRTHPALHAAGGNMVEAAAPETSRLGQLDDYACGSETRMEKWLASKAVQVALHVNTSGRMHYDANVGDLRPLYKKLVAKYKVLIYSGNVDACVPTWGSEFWTRELGEPHGVQTAWHPWTSDAASPGSSKSVLAGYAITYGINNFTFVTVKGAGHEVPRYKPAFALTMIDKFLKGTPF